MFNVGPLELMVILIVALLVVGPNRLPEVGRSIGRGLREFRKAQDEVRATLQTALAEEPPASRVANPAPATGAEPDAVETSTDRDAAAAEPGSEPDVGSEAVEMARTLGRGLAELRRAREEIKRTFKVDLSDVTAPPRVDRPGATRSAAPGGLPAAPQSENTEQTPPEEPAAAE